MRSFDSFMNNKITIFGKENKKEFNFITEHKSFHPDGSEFIALDLKTTGLFPDVDHIVEISAVLFSKGNKIKTFNYVEYLENDLENNENKVTESDMVENLLNFIKDYTIVAHNVTFNMKFIKNACKKHLASSKCKIENQVIDTIKLSRKVYPKLPNHQLKTISDHMDYTPKAVHRTTNDALISSRIYMEYIKFLKEQEEKTFDSLSQAQKETMDIVKNILENNNRPTGKLDVYTTKIYFDLTYNGNNFVRFKIDGNKKYLLTDHNVKTAEKLYGNKFDIGEPSNMEGDKSRIMMENIDDIKKMEAIILEGFDKEFEK